MAVAAGAKTHFNALVTHVDVDASEPTVQLADGRTFVGDIVIGADGPESANFEYRT